ncbi:MAG: ABC transporter permease [Verrucomicrobia bacterium]|nr:ABC transporter permease [Verrucomicrobiota bacterium]
MNGLFRGFYAILYKEFIVVLRDRATLFFMFFPPLLQIIAFGFALDNDVKHMAMVVLDEDHTVESRQLIDDFVNTQTFRVVGEVGSVQEMAVAIRRRQAYVGLQIPPDFSRRRRDGQTARLQVLVDGSSSTIALQALNTALGIGFRESATLLLTEAGRDNLPIEVRPQVLYNPAMLSPNFFVPGVIGVALQIATVFSTAMSLAREKERGTIEQLLVSPLSRWGLMLGKLVPYLVIGMIMAMSLFAILRWVFFVHIVGSVAALLVASLLYLFTLLSLGLLVSIKAENHMQAFQMAMVVLMPSIFFSGFIFPRETMPWIFYAISTLLPATYYIELMRAIILRGASLHDFAFHLGVLAVMGLVLFSLCALLFRKRIT